MGMLLYSFSVGTYYVYHLFVQNLHHGKESGDAGRPLLAWYRRNYQRWWYVVHLVFHINLTTFAFIGSCCSDFCITMIKLRMFREYFWRILWVKISTTLMKSWAPEGTIVCSSRRVLQSPVRKTKREISGAPMQTSSFIWENFWIDEDKRSHPFFLYVLTLQWNFSCEGKK